MPSAFDIPLPKTVEECVGFTLGSINWGLGGLEKAPRFELARILYE